MPGAPKRLGREFQGRGEASGGEASGGGRGDMALKMTYAAH